MERTPTPPPVRSFDIELSSQEVITVDLDNLDPNPSDVLDLLKEGQCKVGVWTKLTGEYWRKGYIEAAEKIALAAVDSFRENRVFSSLPPIYQLLANLELAQARKAPKVVLPDARQDKFDEKHKEEYYKEAVSHLNLADKAVLDSGGEGNAQLAFLTRGIQQLATRSIDDALRTFEGVLAEKPTNLVALLGKARILYARRQYAQALKIFQEVLRLNPACNPDPRIGIGLCLWAMDHKAKAKAAWQRSMEVNPSDWPAQLLLGLESINVSKAENISEEERAHYYVTGTKLLERAFRTNQKNAAAANALCELFLRKGNYQRALKLAERTIQFADTLSLLTEGYVRAGRVSHAEGSVSQARKFFTAATEGQSKHALASVGLAQMQMLDGEMAAAIHTLDTLLQPPNPQRSVETMVMLASLRIHPRPGVSADDMEKERRSARELFDRAMKLTETDDALRPKGPTNGVREPSESSRKVIEDMDMHAEIARLWQHDSLDRTAKALRQALRISEASGRADPRLLNNLAALQHLEGNFDEARAMYERALTSAAGLDADIAEGMSTTILYNLARIYEEQNDDAKAKEVYDKLLARHPEYVDAKVRLAQMLIDVNCQNEAHDLLKQALASQSNNLNLRALYTWFLIRNDSARTAKDLVFATLKDHARYDVYSLCAAGWIMYHQARENRDPSPRNVQDRKDGFRRAAEFYEKALQLDPLCAVAAQGLAIATAEDALGIMSGGAPPTSSADESQKRMKNARDALDVFGKVRESINDGSVYFNMGHCYYARDEFDRAIESYETASTRFYNGQNIAALLCLCRSWHAKANKDQSFAAMKNALRYAQQALHLQPSDKVVLYNIAMIQQKAAEILFATSPQKRSSKDLKDAIDQAENGKRLFASLAEDKVEPLPYSREIADQRRKYGESMLRAGEKHLTSQKKYEDENQARLEAARLKRQEERQRQEALEQAKLEEHRRQAEVLVEERRKAREQAMEWTREIKEESDEERERKVKKAARKVKVEGDSGDEAPGEPKKKRRSRIKKENGEEPALFSDEEEEKPLKKRGPKKRIVRDEDEEEAAGGPRKKQFKSKEMLSDTDDEMS